MFRFLHATQFSTGFIFGPNPGGFPAGPDGQPKRRQVESFLLAFDTNHKPIVGPQITTTGTIVTGFLTSQQGKMSTDQLIELIKNVRQALT